MWAVPLTTRGSSLSCAMMGNLENAASIGSGIEKSGGLLLERDEAERAVVENDDDLANPEHRVGG